jgi:hypothetical protein
MRSGSSRKGGNIRNKSLLIVVIVGAMLTMGAKLTPQLIEDFASIAGKWKGSGRIPSYSTAFSLILIIHEDGSYEMPGHGYDGVMRISDGKIHFRSGFSGLPVVVTLYQDGRKRILKAVYEDGMTWKVNPAKERKKN